MQLLKLSSSSNSSLNGLALNLYSSYLHFCTKQLLTPVSFDHQNLLTSYTELHQADDKLHQNLLTSDALRNAISNEVGLIYILQVSIQYKHFNKMLEDVGLEQ